MPALSQLQTPGDIVAFFYQFALSIVGVCVFVMFLYAGLQLILFGDTNRAKQVALDAAMGLILLFGAYLILNSINPSLVDQQSPSLTGTGTTTGSQGFQGHGGRSGGGGATGSF